MLKNLILLKIMKQSNKKIFTINIINCTNIHIIYNNLMQIIKLKLI